MSAQTETLEKSVNEPTEPAAEVAPGKSRPPVVAIILGVAALIGIGFGVQRILWNRTHVGTDDAQVEGYVVPTLARVGGFVAQIAVGENQVVKAGDLLVRLDDREQRARLEQAQADLATALAAAGERGRTGQAQAQLEAARAQVTLAEANAVKARSDVDRYVTLAARNIVSKQQLDGARAATDVADAALLSARKQVLAAEAGVQGAGARLEAARAARDQAALQLSYTRITAPVSGVVSKNTLEMGQYLQAGQSTMAIVPLDDVWVVANMKETDVEHIRVGDPVRIHLDSYPHHDFHGKVESLSPATGAKFSLLPPDNATGNFTRVVQRIPVRIRFDGPADPVRPLRPGMSADVEITTSTR